MGRRQLHIDHNKVIAKEGLTQSVKSDFGCIATAMKHRFAIKTAAKAQAVKTTDQLLPGPNFNGMTMSPSKEVFVGGDHLCADPCSRQVPVATHGASANDRSKSLIKGDAIFVPTQNLAQGSGRVKIAGKKNTTGHRRPPKDRLAGVIPGEDAL